METVRTSLRSILFGLIVGLGCIGGLAVLADDSVASLGAGGIVLQKTDEIAILSEDLFVGTDVVRVRFAFRNETPLLIETLVAFALPDIDFEDYSKHADLIAAPADTLNFIGFSVVIDGRALTPKVDARALLAGRDVTELVRGFAVPVSFFHPDFQPTLKALSVPARQGMIARGLLVADTLGEMLEPNWTLCVRFYWHQRFPPERTVTVDHSYKPIVGIDPNFSPGHLQQEDRERYCIDHPVQGKLARLAEKSRHDAATARRLDYLLTSGGNWRGGEVGTFRLAVDTAAPQTVLASCFEGLSRTGPTTYEASRENFVPRRDLHFLFVEEQPRAAE